MTLTLPHPTPRADVYIRPLLPRSTWYIVPTSTLVASLSALIVREQFVHSVEQTVEWALALYDVRTVTGDVPKRSAEQIGNDIADLIEAAVGDDEVSLRTTLEKVHAVLAPVFGRQLRVTGWLPGHRVGDGRAFLELSGDTCPNCAINPTGYKVGDRTNTARCLNSEDCGWKAA